MESCDELLSPTEVSRILKVSRRTVLRWLEKGKLRGVRVGERLIKIPRDVLDGIVTPYKRRGASDMRSGNPEYASDPFLRVEEWAPGPVEKAPKDLAAEHDHYLYGAPRRKQTR